MSSEEPTAPAPEDAAAQDAPGEQNPEASSSKPLSEEERKAKAAESQKIDPSQIPEASFPLMISMFTTQAMGALGLIPNPITGEMEFQPELARHYIEMLAIQEKKTKGNLDENEAKLMETSLHELRIMFVQNTKKE